MKDTQSNSHSKRQTYGSASSISLGLKDIEVLHDSKIFLWLVHIVVYICHIVIAGFEANKFSHFYIQEWYIEHQVKWSVLQCSIGVGCRHRRSFVSCQVMPSYAMKSGGTMPTASSELLQGWGIGCLDSIKPCWAPSTNSL
jgi:hypothetical protein